MADALAYIVGGAICAALLAGGMLLDRFIHPGAPEPDKPLDVQAGEALDVVQSFCCPRHPDCACQAILREVERRARIHRRARTIARVGVSDRLWHKFVVAHPIDIDGGIDA